MTLSEISYDCALAADQTNGQIKYDSLLDAVDTLPVEEVPIALLAPGPFRRELGNDPAHVQMIVESATIGDLPPILLQRNSFRIIDGMHRFEAAKQRGDKTIKARLVDCTDNDAFMAAVKANMLHGLPLTRADRVLGAKRILGWHPDWSDRAISTATGLSAKTIVGIRQQQADETQQLGKRLGRDGKRRPVTAREGRKRVVEFIAARPDASLREVAQATDVSLGTVQDVRARMRRGLDPLAPRSEVTPLPAVEDQGQATEPAAPALPLPGRMARRGEQPDAAWPGWPEVSRKLMGDPSLRYTERGRALMRWLLKHVAETGQWREFADSVPARWLDEISSVAERASDDWREFAEYLKERQAQAV